MTTAAQAAPTQYGAIRLSERGSVRRLTLDRPERRNAQTPAMWADIDLALDVLTADEEVKVLVIEGAGGSFSSGIDLAELGPGGFLRALADIAPQQPDPALEAIARAQRPFRRLRATPFIVVAAVRGVALGAGLELALACDFTIVSTTARLAVSEVGRGVVPDLGATWALPRLVGPQRALDLILTSREFTGLEAAEYGVALAAVPDGEVEAAADAYAARLATVPGRVLAHAKAATLASDEGASMRAAAVGMAESIRSLLGPA